MGERRNRPDAWLDTATAGVRFGPDRAAVRGELEAHLEDKAADLQRIFPELTAEEARVRALEQMGDAAEIGRELAKIHRPWLGWLWRASKWTAAALVLVLVAVSVLKNGDFRSAGHPLWGRADTVYGPTAGEAVQLGGYTFRIVGAAYVEYPEDSPYADSVQVAFRVSTPRFWERINEGALQSVLTMTGPEGWAWDMDRGKMNTIWEQWTSQTLCGLRRAEWGLFHDTYIAYGDWEWEEGDSAGLEFAFGKGSFTLTADELERVVIT